VRVWKGDPVRDLLEVEIEVKGSVLHLFDNHWKSKIGGTRETEASRLESSGIVARRVREILMEDPSADIVVAGDMNENIDEYIHAVRKYQTALIEATEKTPVGFSRRSLFLSGNARNLGMVGDRLVLYEPWFEFDEAKRGSYVYQGEWQTMDHILLSPGLLDSRGFSYRWGSFRVVRLSFLLLPDGAPKKWSGLEAQRGYSDHLPLLVTLDVKN
jgi:endonuclease/exonuclease/phosphatase family metal-dependent hydrolase